MLSFLFLDDLATCYLISKQLYDHAKTFSPSFEVDDCFDFETTPYSALCYEPPFLYARQAIDGEHSVIQFKYDEDKNQFIQVQKFPRIQKATNPLLKYNKSRNCLILNEYSFVMSNLVFIDLSPVPRPNSPYKSRYHLSRKRLYSRRILLFSDLFNVDDSYYIWITPVPVNNYSMHLWKVDTQFNSICIKRIKTSSISMHTYPSHHNLKVVTSIDYCNSNSSVVEVALEFLNDPNPRLVDFWGVKVKRYDSSVVGTTPLLLDSFDISRRSIRHRRRMELVTDFLVLEHYLIIGVLGIGIDIYDLKFSRLFETIPFPSFRGLCKTGKKIMIICSASLFFVCLKSKAKFVLK